jgi:hypothetical protein
MNISNSTGVRYGDYVLIRHSKPFEGFLAADGLLFGDTFLLKQDEETLTLEDCIWEVYVQNQYAAIKEYESKMMFGLTDKDVESKEWHKLSTTLHQANKVLSQKQGSSHAGKKTKPKSMEERKADIMGMLRSATINEQRLNEKTMALKVGKPVAFGDLIQLRHVKSNKFMTVNQYTLAKMERENLRILVQSRGDSFSCLTFMPRYKNDKEGQRITHNSDVIIK